MKKSIIFPVSHRVAVEQYGYDGSENVVLFPLEVDLDKLSDAGRVIAENVKTFDKRDDLSIIYVSGPSSEELDIMRDMPQERVEMLSKAWGGLYTDPYVAAWKFGLMKKDETPEQYIERNVSEMRKCGVRMITRGWSKEINYNLAENKYDLQVPMTIYLALLSNMGKYTDPDTYAGDMAFSSVWGERNKYNEDIAKIKPACRKLWDVFHMDVKGIAAAAGMSLQDMAERFGISYNTITKWTTSKDSPNHRECPAHSKRMMIELLNLLPFSVEK